MHRMCLSSFAILGWQLVCVVCRRDSCSRTFPGYSVQSCDILPIHPESRAHSTEATRHHPVFFCHFTNTFRVILDSYAARLDGAIAQRGHRGRIPRAFLCSGHHNITRVKRLEDQLQVLGASKPSLSALNIPKPSPKYSAW